MLTGLHFGARRPVIYLDPPFNSNANHNILFKSKTGDGADAQIAFEDIWHWNDLAEAVFRSRKEVLALMGY